MKKIAKRLIITVMALVMSVSAVDLGCLSVKAADEQVTKNNEIEIPGDGRFETKIYGEKIKNNDVKYTFKDGVLTAEGTGYADASYNCNPNFITKIVIGKGIKGIADCAFEYLNNLETISIPDSVVEIGYYAFKSSHLKSLILPTSVKKIGATAFYSTNKFSVTMPGDFKVVWTSYLEEEDDLITLGFKDVHLNTPYNPAIKKQFKANNIYTMKGDKKYKSYKGVVYTKSGKTLVQVPINRKKINIRKGCTKILMSAIVFELEGDETYYSLYNLNKVTIPKTVKKIVNDRGNIFNDLSAQLGQGDVKWTVNTKKLTGKSVENLYGMMQGTEAEKFIKSKKARLKKRKPMMITKDNVLIKYTGKSKTVKIPKIIKRIGQGAFDYNKKIKKVVLNKKLKEIGFNAFSECKKLKTVVWNKKLKNVDDFAFYNCKIKTLKLPANVTKWGKYCFANNGSTKITIPKNMKTIPNGFFEDSKVKNIVVPGTVKRIGACAFNGSKCNNITIKEGVKYIDRYAFETYSKVEKVVIPKSMIRIESEAFRETRITELVINNPDVELGKDAFDRAYEINLGTDPTKFFTYGVMAMTDAKGNVEFYRAKVKGASGMDVEVSENKDYSNPFVKSDITNEYGKVTFKRPSDNYTYYRIRVYTIKDGVKVYGPWRSFGWL